jgi:DNA-binding transcriptional LysR family regulator
MGEERHEGFDDTGDGRVIFRANTGATLLEATAAGLGVAALPCFLADEERGSSAPPGGAHPRDLDRGPRGPQALAAEPGPRWSGNTDLNGLDGG